MSGIGADEVATAPPSQPNGAASARPVDAEATAHAPAPANAHTPANTATHADTPGNPATDADTPAHPTTDADTPAHPTTDAHPPAGAAADAARAGQAGRLTGAEAATPTDGRVSLVKRDRWAAFAPAGESPPGRIQQLTARVWRVVAHEWTLAALGSTLLAIVMTWPTMRHPRRTIPQDIWDPTLQAWQMAWSGHALRTDPTRIWHSNTFYPERYSFAFSDMLLGYAPAGLLGTGPVAAVLRYNVIFMLVFALAFFGAYALVRQLGGTRSGAAVAAAAFAYAPWRWAQAGHLHVLSSGGIVLALAMLARGHGWSLRHGYRPDRLRPGWAIAGWLVAAWQLSLGFGIGLPFAYALALLAVVAAVGWTLAGWRTELRNTDGLRGWWARRPPFPTRLLLADLGGALAFAATGAFMAYPYLRVVQQHPYARRTTADLELFSPSIAGFLTAPPESAMWGPLHAGLRERLSASAETSLLLGFVLCGLAAAGLVVSVWSVRTRFVLAAGAVVATVLAMGTQAPLDGRASYLVLYELLPGWDAIRTPGRLVLWTTLLLAILAAGAVSAFAERAWELAEVRVPARPGALLRLAMVLPLVLVLLEGRSASPHPTVPGAPAVLSTAEPPLLVLPSDQLNDENIMLWGTDRFPAMVNGGSGFLPRRQQRVRLVAQNFPDTASVQLLRELGVRTVVVLKDRVTGTPYAGSVNAPVDGLGIQRQDVGNAVVFRL